MCCRRLVQNPYMIQDANSAWLTDVFLWLTSAHLFCRTADRAHHSACEGQAPEQGCVCVHRFTGSKEYSRILRASVCLFWGRWFLPVPYKHNIISLVGQPITGGRHSWLHRPLTMPILRGCLCRQTHWSLAP